MEKPTFWVPANILAQARVGEFARFFCEKCKNNSAWKKVGPKYDMGEFVLGVLPPEEKDTSQVEMTLEGGQTHGR